MNRETQSILSNDDWVQSSAELGRLLALKQKGTTETWSLASNTACRCTTSIRICCSPQVPFRRSTGATEVEPPH